ncbi:MAG: HAMP domain-containing sensor histidine kinase, partial [Pseudonocardiales bacterium]|nr:HAMP domain-containing sensor histidine kinase [Pseudonocardiales bacterium]
GGAAVSGAVRSDGVDLLVEARPAAGGAVALVREADLPAVALVRRNLLFAFLAGGLVALVVGPAVARVLARPLRRTAAAARRMQAGHRDVRVPVEGPAEVAQVAGAVNGLADALAHSEGRQRAFLLSVSHELRTPLTAVRGFGESIADGVVTGEAALAAGRTVVDEALRLERLVDDLLELARTSADDFRLDVTDVDLTALLAAAAAVWGERSRAAGVRFSHTAPPGPLVVRTDPRRLRQVLDGLAENALRVTPAGAALHLALAAEPGAARLEVRDSGPGIDPADAPDVFRRGALHERYRGARPVGSAGIGLALVHGLVTRLGGTVAVGRAPEGGAAFAVRLPRP